MEGKDTGKEKEKKKVINRYVVSSSFAKLEFDLGTVGKALGAKKTTPDRILNICFHSSFAIQLPSLWLCLNHVYKESQRKSFKTSIITRLEDTKDQAL